MVLGLSTRFKFTDYIEQKGKGLLERFGYGNEEGMKQFVLLEQTPSRIESKNATKAALDIAHRLEFPITLLSAFRVVPEFTRNGLIFISVKAHIA